MAGYPGTHSFALCSSGGEPIHKEGPDHHAGDEYTIKDVDDAKDHGTRQERRPSRLGVGPLSSTTTLELTPV